MLAAAYARSEVNAPAARCALPTSQAMLRLTRFAFFASILIAPIAQAQQSAAHDAMPPEQERQLARAIYKEMIEIKSGFTTGSTTPVAQAAARRLRAAGFPDRDIFVGGATPNKANLVV